MKVFIYLLLFELFINNCSSYYKFRRLGKDDVLTSEEVESLPFPEEWNDFPSPIDEKHGSNKYFIRQYTEYRDYKVLKSTHPNTILTMDISNLLKPVLSPEYIMGEFPKLQFEGNGRDFEFVYKYQHHLMNKKLITLNPLVIYPLSMPEHKLNENIQEHKEKLVIQGNHPHCIPQLLILDRMGNIYPQALGIRIQSEYKLNFNGNPIWTLIFSIKYNLVNPNFFMALEMNVREMLNVDCLYILLNARHDIKFINPPNGFLSLIPWFI